MVSGWTLYPPSPDDVARWGAENGEDIPWSKRYALMRQAEFRAAREDLAVLAGKELTHVHIDRSSVALRFVSDLSIQVRINKVFHFRLHDGSNGTYVADAHNHDMTEESLGFAFLVGKICSGICLSSRILVLDFESRAAIWAAFDDEDGGIHPIHIYGWRKISDKEEFKFYYPL